MTSVQPVVHTTGLYPYRKTRVVVSRSHCTQVDATNRERRPCTQARQATVTLVLPQSVPPSSGTAKIV